MNRRTAILLGSLVAAVAAAELIILSGLLAAERQDDRARYAAAIAQQRRAAGRALLATDDPSERAPQRTTFCVHGVDTFVTTVYRALDAQLIDDSGRLDVSELGELSNLAIRAERYVEQANAGPALPQRMGRARHKDEQGDTVWKPLEPAQRECDDGDAYAMFRLDPEAPERAADEPADTASADAQP